MTHRLISRCNEEDRFPVPLALGGVDEDYTVVGSAVLTDTYDYGPPLVPRVEEVKTEHPLYSVYFAFCGTLFTSEVVVDSNSKPSKPARTPLHVWDGERRFGPNPSANVHLADERWSKQTLNRFIRDVKPNVLIHRSPVNGLKCWQIEPQVGWKYGCMMTLIIVPHNAPEYIGAVMDYNFEYLSPSELDGSPILLIGDSSTTEDSVKAQGYKKSQGGKPGRYEYTKGKNYYDRDTIAPVMGRVGMDEPIYWTSSPRDLHFQTFSLPDDEPMYEPGVEPEEVDPRPMVIIGHAGAGKTTMAKKDDRFIDPDLGVDVKRQNEYVQIGLKTGDWEPANNNMLRLLMSRPPGKILLAHGTYGADPSIFNILGVVITEEREFLKRVAKMDKVRGAAAVENRKHLMNAPELKQYPVYRTFEEVPIPSSSKGPQPYRFYYLCCPPGQEFGDYADAFNSTPGRKHPVTFHPASEFSELNSRYARIVRQLVEQKRLDTIMFATVCNNYHEELFELTAPFANVGGTHCFQAYFPRYHQKRVGLSHVMYFGLFFVNGSRRACLGSKPDEDLETLRMAWIQEFDITLGLPRIPTSRLSGDRI